VHTCNPSTCKAEGGSQNQGQPGLHSEILSQKKIFFYRVKKIFEKLLHLSPALGAGGEIGSILYDRMKTYPYLKRQVVKNIPLV
jgi:hypothetical protein